MIQRSPLLALLVLILTVLTAYSCTKKNSGLNEQNEDTGRILDYTGVVTFIKAESDTISTIEVAVADESRSRTEGLMNVLDLPENSGMLFIFQNQQPRSFWMANTPLSLDILFIDSEMSIVRIHRNTQPYSQESISSEEPAMFVVEVNAGYTLEHDIREGMKITIDGIEL